MGLEGPCNATVYNVYVAGISAEPWRALPYAPEAAVTFSKRESTPGNLHGNALG